MVAMALPRGVHTGLWLEWLLDHACFAQRAQEGAQRLKYVQGITYIKCFLRGLPLTAHLHQYTLSLLHPACTMGSSGSKGAEPPGASSPSQVSAPVVAATPAPKVGKSGKKICCSCPETKAVSSTVKYAPLRPPYLPAISLTQPACPSTSCETMWSYR